MKIFCMTFCLRTILLVGAAIFIPLFIHPLAVDAQCNGQERWDVKTGTDNDVSRVNTISQSITIPEMNGLNHGLPYGKKRLHHQQENRIRPYELQVYHVEGTLIWYKCECDQAKGDQDYHLVIQSEYGATVIAEIPNPSCVAAGSPFLDQIRQARAAMDSKFTPAGRKQKANVRVAIEGPAFFDFKHGQLGHARNYVEIHPVLKLEFK